MVDVVRRKNLETHSSLRRGGVKLDASEQPFDEVAS
jgi:hypothetical protein